MNVNRIIIFCFILIFILGIVLQEVGLGVRFSAIIPDFVSLIFISIFLVVFGLKKELNIQSKYVILFIMFLLTVTVGLVLNNVKAGTIIAGIRNYFKYLPFFLVPIVYNFSDEDLKKQIKLFLIMILIQLPLAVYQKFFKYYHLDTGDYIGGTFSRAPQLSLFLLSGMSVLAAFYFTNKLPKIKFVILLILLFIPSALNETKAAPLLLPFAIIIPAILSKNETKNLKKVIAISIIIGTSLTLFQIIYTKFYNPKFHVINYFISDKATNYLKKSQDLETLSDFGPETEHGRFDAVIYSYHFISKDIGRVFFGVGIGNASKSFISKYDGKFKEDYEKYGGKMTTISHMMWETGFLGIFLIICFKLMILIDSFKLAVKNIDRNIIGLSWVGVAFIFLLATVYQNLVDTVTLTIFYFYFSGLVVSNLYRNTGFRNNL